MASKPLCPVCDSKKAAFLCQSCINAQLYDEKKKELRQQRDELQEQLETALAKRVRVCVDARAGCVRAALLFLALICSMAALALLGMHMPSKASRIRMITQTRRCSNCLNCLAVGAEARCVVLGMRVWCCMEMVFMSVSEIKPTPTPTPFDPTKSRQQLSSSSLISGTGSGECKLHAAGKQQRRGS